MSVRVLNRTGLAVLAICNRDTLQPSVLLYCLAVRTDLLRCSNAEYAERIRAMILSDDVSGDDSIDDETECDGDYVETRGGDSDRAEDAASGVYC